MDWKSWYVTMRGAPVSAWTAAQWTTHLESPSGYEREEAIQALMRLRVHATLPTLLRRINDWVPQVREAARVAVRAFLVEEAIPAWSQAMPVMIDLLRGRRADHGPLLEEIAAFLTDPARLPVLAAAQPHMHPLVRRWLDLGEWRVASEAQRAAMLSARLGGADIVTARWALERVEELVSTTARPALWLTGCGHMAGPVRAHALRRLCEAAPEAGTAMALQLALDPRAGVREVALAQLRKAQLTDPIRQRAQLQLETPASAPHHGVPALLFLAQIDPADATARCARLMAMRGNERPRAALRAVALQHLIAGSDGDTQQHWLRQAIGDASSRAQRVAVNAVSLGASPPTPRELWPLVFEHQDVGALRRGLRVLEYWGVWTQLHELLGLARLPLPEGGEEELVAALSRWEVSTRRGVTAPGDPQASQLRDLWRTGAVNLPAAIRARLRYALTVSGLLAAD